MAISELDRSSEMCAADNEKEVSVAQKTSEIESVEFTTSSACTPESSVLLERINCTLFGKLRALPTHRQVSNR